MKGRTLSATGLRLSLSLLLFVITLIAAVALSLANTWLQEYATDVSHATIDANASQDNIQTLQKIQQELTNDKDIIERASSIVADSQSYQYQDQIITDLNNYAERAGIAITNIDFIGSTPVAGATPTPAPSVAPSGVKSTSVSVTLKNPVNYDNLLQFIKSIEQNLTKMQVSKIGLAKDAQGGVTSEVLTVEVYIR
jgi:hypothetical protein